MIKAHLIKCEAQEKELTVILIFMASISSVLQSLKNSHVSGLHLFAANLSHTISPSSVCL